MYSNLKKYLSLYILLIMIIGGCGNDNKNDRSLQRIKERGYFIAGIDEQSAPLCFRDPGSNELTGFFTEFVKEIAKRLGVKIQFRAVSPDKAAEKLNSGEIDMFWNATPLTENYSSQISTVNPYINSRQVILLRKNNDISTIPLLAGKRIGFLQNSNSEIAFNTSGSFARKIKDVNKYDSLSTALTELDGGRVDAVIIDEIIADWNMAVKPGIFRKLDDDIGSEFFAIGIRKSDTIFKAELEKIMSAISGKNTGKKMSIKWFGSNILLD